MPLAMPLAVILFVIDITLVVHAAKTGRFSPCGYVILMLPGIGALAYVLVELLPEWFGSAQGQNARRRLVNTLDPERRYRADYYPGAEARVRYGLFLDRLGRRTEARVVLSDVLTHMKRAPKYVRRVQAESIAAAEKVLRI